MLRSMGDARSAMRKFSFYQVDVFTRRRYAGNPLAVVLDADRLGTRQMQAIAREMNLSETTFVLRPRDRRARRRVRIFTIARELPLAGHPVVGTWFLLAELGVVRPGTREILQEIRAGILPVTFAWRGRKASSVTMTQRPAEFFAARPPVGELARSLSLSPQDLDAKLPAEFVSTGVKHLLVPVRSDSAVLRVEADYPRLKRLLGRYKSVLAYVFSLKGQRAHARGFAADEGFEDPATGSAAGPLGAYLVQHGRIAAGQTLWVAQGLEIGRPSKILVEVERTAGNALVPRVSGSAVIVARGEILA